MFEEEYPITSSALQERNNQQIYSTGPQHSQLKDFLQHIDQQNDSEDEGIEDYIVGGYHPVHIGEVLIKRYVVIQKLGWGHFSTVWLCKDFKYDTYVAVKIQKSSPHYMEAAFDEVEILQRVETESHNKDWKEGRDGTHVVGLLNAFLHKSNYGNHFCMVFEILRCNLLEVIKRYNYEGLPLDICQEISKQVLKGLDFLHRVCGVIHTDLKPENVMLCLSDEEVKELVENGQLSSNQLFAERMKIMQKMMGMSPAAVSTISTKSNRSERNDKISELQDMLKDESLSKGQKKNIKKKLKREKQKENEEQRQSQQTSEGAFSQQPSRIEDLFDVKKGRIKFNRGGQLKMPFRIKIADLGNACWKHHHFSTQIQTRQYRSPQVILGLSYNETSDIWSFGCMMYEMLTGDLLFQPRKNENWSKNDDHLAQIQELIGNFHPHFIARSPKRKHYFNKDGTMRRMPTLCHYPLEVVLQMKNRVVKEQAAAFGEFLQMSLITEPELRATAQKMLNSRWLTRSIPKDYKMEQADYNELREKFNEDEDGFQAPPTKHLVQEPEQHKWEIEEEGTEIQEEAERMADIRLVDRSFADLGYIGYSEGIALGQLDCQANWQFT